MNNYRVIDGGKYSELAQVVNTFGYVLAEFCGANRHHLAKAYINVIS